ncbi:Hypothetical protein NCS54_01286000 [Fusarium falciforme]|uniref:Hypothetical protein n=1 Tax=Fusarium falciforme TaxID=195108 RepID=UPI002301DA4E|nr:Hypothetical protein NCS54_01286000 [Fusarium falciforme]WAO95247.1 Hypothetical protein NCS54_01286000 [Fusarium falciforme]
MDPLSIAAGCAGLISTIGTLSLSIHGFVRTCREARKDLDKVSRELQSLQSVLRLIEDDATNEEKPFPPVIGQHVLSIVSNCNSVILEIEACIAQYGQKRLKAQVTWAIGGQGDVEKLRTNLEAHKSSLELALDMHSLAITKDIKADTAEIRHDTTSIRENTEQILQEIVRLQAQLPKDVTTPNDYVLQRFLEEMTTYTEMALDITIVGSDDDSIQAFYDIEEVSEASADQKRSDDSLATSNEPQPPNVSEAERASEPPAKTNPSGKLTSSPEPPSQQPAASRKAVKHFSRRWNKRSLLQADHAEFPASHGPSKNEATSAQQRASAVKEASASKDLDTGARGKKVQGRGVTLRPSEAPMPKSSDDDPGTSKEPQPARLSNDEAPALDFIPGSKVVASESTDASNTENKKSKRRTTALNEPTIDSSGNAHVKLFDGNLAVDFRYLNPLANKGHLFSISPSTYDIFTA